MPEWLRLWAEEREKWPAGAHSDDEFGDVPSGPGWLRA